MSTEAWRSLSEHLDQALELSDEERVGWLENLRDLEPALAVKLAELLEVRAQKGYSEFLAGPSLILGDPAWRRDALRLVLAHARLSLAKTWPARRTR